MLARALSTLVALSLLCLVTACATTAPEATTDFDASYDFSGVQTIAIQPVDRTALSNIKVSDMQIARIDEAIRNELESKGFRVVGSNDDADMLLTWHLVTEERTDVRTYNSMSYYNCWRCGPSVSDVSVSQYTLGTFIVDMIDPLRNRSVWRSVIQSRLKPQPDPEKSARFRREAAAAIFAQFPPA